MPLRISMLKSLEFENFKSWGGRHRLDFGRITGLFGANSSGKSSILQLLLLLKQTAESQDPQAVLHFGSGTTSYMDFGGFIDIVTDHDLSKNFSYCLSWSPDSRAQRYFDSRVDDIVLSGTIIASDGLRGEEISVSRLKYAIECSLDAEIDSSLHSSFGSLTETVSGVLSVSLDRQHTDTYTLTVDFDGDVSDFFNSDDALAPIGLYRIRPEDMDAVIHGLDLRVTMNIEDESRSEEIESEYKVSSYTIEHAMERVSMQTSRLLERIVYLGPLRNYPLRDYRWTGVAPATVGHRGEQAIQVLLADKSARIDVVSKWLRRLGVAASLSLRQVGQGARIWEPMVRQQGGSTAVNLADVGFGVSQILPVVVALLSAPSGSLVILEHPDIHLHPRAQAELADLLIEIASTNEIQILLESHSEHLLARIQRRISESARGKGSLEPEDARLYFCEQANGKSKLTPLEVQASGVIANWPRNFFGDMLTERMALSGFYPDSSDQTADS